MVPIDYNGFGASFTPNPYFSRETWKRLLSENPNDKNAFQ